MADAESERRSAMPEEDVLTLIDRYSNAGRWGPDDELGTLNFIDVETRLRAVASTVRIGRVMSIGKDINTVASPTNPIPAVHRMLDAHPSAASDLLEIAPHGLAVTHLDALGHMFAEGRAYNGRRAADIVTSRGLSFGSIHAQRDGIIARGVLLDIAASRGVLWLDPDAEIYPEDLERAEELAGTRLGRGDAVVVRVGLGAREAAEGPEDPNRRAGMMPECIRWLHEREVALFGGDCFDHVPLPYERMRAPFHQIALSSLGMPFLDALELEELSVVCAELRRYDFLLVVAPLRVIGGTGSPVNPLCCF